MSQWETWFKNGIVLKIPMAKMFTHRGDFKYPDILGMEIFSTMPFLNHGNFSTMPFLNHGDF